MDVGQAAYTAIEFKCIVNSKVQKLFMLEGEARLKVLPLSLVNSLYGLLQSVQRIAVFTLQERFTITVLFFLCFRSPNK